MTVKNTVNERFADDVLVMYAGQIVETGVVDDLFENPQMPYAWGLLDSLPRLDDERGAKLRRIQFRIDRKMKAESRADGDPSQLAFLKRARETVERFLNDLDAELAGALPAAFAQALAGDP